MANVLPNVTVEAFFGLAWVDISAYVRSGQITRGSSRYDGSIVRYEAGTAQVVLDNTDGRFDPTNLSGPYVWANGTQLLPGTPWRIRSTYGSGYPLWQGYADLWDLSYEQGGKDATCTLSGTDWTKPAQSLGVSAVEPNPVISGTVVSDILASLSITGSVDSGDSFVQGGTLTESNAWDFLQLITDSELGELYVRGDGVVVFRRRKAIFEDTRSATSQATFGDAGSELRYETLHIANDDVQMKNNVTAQNVGGTVQSVADSSSTSQFGFHDYSRTDLILTTDTEAHDWAGYVVAISAGHVFQNGVDIFTGDTRIDSLTIRPAFDPTNLNPQVLGRELGDRITVKARPVGRGAGNPIVRDAFIRGIQHTFAPGNHWETVWTLQDATRFQAFVFDSATIGLFDYDFFGM